MKKLQKYLGWRSVLSMALTLITLIQLSQQAIAQGNTILADKTSQTYPAVLAREVFRLAYLNRYTWDKNFPGYTATVKIKQGNEEHNGYIKIKPDLSVEVTGINSADARQTVEEQLQTIVVHRRRIPFEVAHKNHTYTMGKTDDTGAVEILEKGDSSDARYKVYNSQITQVNRILGDTSVTVNLLDSVVTPKGYIATRYRTIFRQPQTAEILGEREFEDTYQQVGDYYLLKRQVIRDFPKKEPQTTTFIDFNNIELLPKVSTKKPSK
jgi:hypothetical protein